MPAKIYLDFNSTHPPLAAILGEARAFYFEHFANSSGLSLASQHVNKRIDEARDTVAHLIGVTARQIVFTSCATEANNLIIREHHARHPGGVFRVLSSPFEHPSVSECLKRLTNCEITYFKANHDGTIDAAAFDGIPWGDYHLITMMAVQNESGVVLPIKTLAAALPAAHPPVLVDFSQALPKCAHDATDELKPEFIGELTQKNFFVTATGHKLGAGFGAGLVVLPHGMTKNDAMPLLAGGNQEHGHRAGSHNTEAIIAFALALQHKLKCNNYALWHATTHDFEARILQKLPASLGASIVGDALPRPAVSAVEPTAMRTPSATEGTGGAETGMSVRAPGTTLLLLPHIPIDFLIMALDREGITVSTGTSCKSRSRTPSAALLAMGYSEAEALSVVRLSYDQNLSTADRERASAAIATAVQKLL